MKNKVYIHTFGCQMNKADSLRLSELFQAQGYSFTEDLQEADVIIYNTCSVRHHAENKAMSYVGRLKDLKEENPSLRVCVVGCMAQRLKGEIITRLPLVDYVVGPSSMFDLPELIQKDETGVYADSREKRKEFPDVEYSSINTSSPFSGYVPIMKGCNNFCAYCIVPYVRGREEYRERKDILKECRELAQRGIKEIMLLGQTVNSHPDFKDILKETAAVEGIERVLFVTSYPGHMDKETVDIVASTLELCNYFHIPVQSGSDRILKEMGRKYTVSHFREIALYIREKLPSASITTDFIVGFPGETEKDFNKTLSLVKEIEFDQCFTFKYSPREGTRSAQLKDNVSRETKKERLARLNELWGSLALKRNRLLVGKSLDVFAEGAAHGRSCNYKIVHWKGDKALPGETVRVKINEALPHSLKGERL
jgi:tRNA-2-methylthio-N6-dimethylallyladenosine synthase